jgi:uncharacterized SAM-binding protein YcdF (DUF218 family)
MVSHGRAANSGNIERKGRTIMTRSLEPKAPQIIVLLGAPNDREGRLSSIARERCDQVVLEHASRGDWGILPTGGFGAHFNETNEPHSVFATRYLITRGIPADRILSGVPSRNTYEDAQLVAERLMANPPGEVIVVTSDFHVARATIVFQRALPDLKMSFVGSITDLPAAELARLRAHEEQAIRRLTL